MSFLSLTDSDREEMLAAIGVASIDELFRDIPQGVRYGRELDIAPALTESELQRHMEELAGKNIVDEVCFLGPGSTTTTSPPLSTRCCSAASC